MGENRGQQSGQPAGQLIEGTRVLSEDGALQISTVWACVERRANIVASLPFFAYKERDGEKVLARTSRLYALLKESPNPRMTPFEFWRAMMLNHDLRGNAYARIDRSPPDLNQEIGEAVALWPMPADQVRPVILDDGSMVYEYIVGGETAVLAFESVLHLKNLGNGTVGLAKLDFMASTTDEMTKAQTNASKVFGNGGKPTGVLMIDSVINDTQRRALKAQYGDLASGTTSRLAVLEAGMKYQQLGLSAQDQQLLETRRYGVEEICRWFDVPSVLVNHPGVVQYGNHDIIEGFFYKLTMAPMLENIEQAFRKRVMTPRQRAGMVCEYQMDALLRGSATQRAEIYSKGLQNGWITREDGRHRISHGAEQPVAARQTGHRSGIRRHWRGYRAMKGQPMEHKGLALEKAQFKLENDGAGFAGYASTFGNVDSYGDTIVKGAYAETLAKNGMPRMFFNHDATAVPIGKWVEAKEDDYGLLLTGEFTPGNALAQEVRAALKHGTLDSMSIGYSLKKGDYEETAAGRLIRKVARLSETSIVTFPADKFARIDAASVKAIDFEALLPECKTERDIERLLRDAGLPKWEAMAIVSRAKAIFDGRDALQDAEAKTNALILERLQKLSA